MCDWDIYWRSFGIVYGDIVGTVETSSNIRFRCLAPPELHFPRGDRLEANGFVLHTQHGGSHRKYRSAEGKYVTIAVHDFGENIRSGTLKSIIRQSGLSAALFRK